MKITNSLILLFIVVTSVIFSLTCNRTSTQPSPSPESMIIGTYQAYFSPDSTAFPGAYITYKSDSTGFMVDSLPGTCPTYEWNFRWHYADDTIFYSSGADRFNTSDSCDAPDWSNWDSSTPTSWRVDTLDAKHFIATLFSNSPQIQTSIKIAIP